MVGNQIYEALTPLDKRICNDEEEDCHGLPAARRAIGTITVCSASIKVDRQIARPLVSPVIPKPLNRDLSIQEVAELSRFNDANSHDPDFQYPI